MSECKTILLPDTPENTDLFNGAHKRLASSIVELIETENGGKSIGIEGGWGSGKSTIINLIKEDLQKNKDNVVIVFDAWAHQDDPLRRSFLETITKQLVEKRWVNEENWKNELDILSKKKQTTETTNSPRLTLFGTLIVIAFLMVPIGLAFLNAALKGPGHISFSGGLFTISLFTAGAILTTLPVTIYTVGAIGIGVCKLLKLIPTIGKGINCNLSFSGAILAQKYDTHTLTSSYSTPEPTSVEFGDKFEQLIKEAISENTRKLVLVLDNLDRIDEDSALSILATLQTFLQHDVMEKQEYRGVWVIIPYDLQGLSKVWSSKRDLSDEVTKSMLNKRFQVRFYVPPLLLSEWREYFINLLKTAFPNHSGENHIKDFNTTYLIYRDLVAFKNNTPPSPRDIKVFINQIGGIHRQWGDEFPIHHIGYFLITDGTAKNYPEKLRNKDLLNLELYELGDDILGDLAAMHFNVERTSAFQFLLREQIEAAIVQKDSNRIQNLEELHRNGFWITFETISFDQFNVRSLAIAGQTLEQSKIFSSEGNDIQKGQILKGLKNEAFKVDILSDFDSEIANGLIAIAKLTNEPAIVTQFSKSILQYKTNAAATAFSVDATSKWAEGVLEIIKNDWVKEKGIQLPEKFTIPGNTGDIINTCAHLHEIESDEDIWAKFKSVHQSQEVVNTFKGLVDEGKMSERYSSALKVATRVIQDAKWNEVANQISTRLVIFNNYENEEVRSSIMSLWDLFDRKYANQKQLNRLYQDGAIFHHLHIAQGKSNLDWNTITWCAYTIFHLPVDINTAPPPNGNAQGGHQYLINQLFKNPTLEFISALINIAIKRDGIGFLINQPSTANKLKQMATSFILKDSPELFTPEITTTSWKTIKEYSGDDFNEYLAKINSDHRVTNYLVTQEFNYENAHLYSSLIQEGNFDNNLSFFEWCKKGLGKISMETWESELDKEGKLAELVIDICEKKKEIPLELDVAFQDALQNHANKTIKNQNNPSYLKDYWHILPVALNKNLRENFRLKILKMIKNADGNIGISFFDCYTKEIPAPEILISDREVVLQIFLPLISNKSLRGMQWLAEFLENNKWFLKDYEPKSAIEELRKRIQVLSQEENMSEDIKQQITRLQNSILTEPN